MRERQFDIGFGSCALLQNANDLVKRIEEFAARPVLRNIAFQETERILEEQVQTAATPLTPPQWPAKKAYVAWTTVVAGACAAAYWLPSLVASWSELQDLRHAIGVERERARVFSDGEKKR